MNGIIGEMLALATGEVPRIEVGPGCFRRDLPAMRGMRAWVVEMDPGSQWPQVDQHPAGEDVYVLEGEMIEGDRRFPAGSWLHFLPGSAHRPRTETGLRLPGPVYICGAGRAGPEGVRGKEEGGSVCRYTTER